MLLLTSACFTVGSVTWSISLTMQNPVPCGTTTNIRLKWRRGNSRNCKNIIWSMWSTNFVIIIFVIIHEIMILFLTVRSRNTPVTVKDMRRSVANVKSRVKLFMSCCK